MKISFVIPAYNEEVALPKCLESVGKEIDRVVAAGELAREDIEVIVVNNASTDKTKEVAQTFSFARVVDEGRKGLVWARKAGFDATSGELVANVDSDTMLPPGWLSTVLTQFKKRKNLVALSGPFIYYDFNPLVRVLVRAFYFPGWFVNIFTENLFGYSTMLQGGNFVIKRDAWLRSGNFDTTITFYGEDADVARRIGKQGRVLWTWSLPIYSSGRRLQKDGILHVAFVYTVNLFATHLTGRPYNQTYTDVRPK